MPWRAMAQYKGLDKASYSRLSFLGAACACQPQSLQNLRPAKQQWLGCTWTLYSLSFKPFGVEEEPLKPDTLDRSTSMDPGRAAEAQSGKVKQTHARAQTHTQLKNKLGETKGARLLLLPVILSCFKK